MPKKDEKSTIKLGGKKIQIKEGALSKQLGIPVEKDIPKSLLASINKKKVGDEVKLPSGRVIKVTALLKKRVSLAITLKGMRGEKKGDISKTRSGDLDYTTKKGDKDFDQKGKRIVKKRKPYTK